MKVLIRVSVVEKENDRLAMFVKWKSGIVNGKCCVISGFGKGCVTIHVNRTTELGAAAAEIQDYPESTNGGEKD